MFELLDALQPPAIIVEEDYTVRYANRAFGEFCGVEPERLLGEKCHVVCHNSETPCQLNGSPCPLREVFRTGRSFSIKHVHRCMGGQEKVFEVQASPVVSPETGRVESMLEILVETGESVEEIKKIRSAEDFLHALLEGIAEGVVVISSDLRIIRANKHYLRMSGLTADELKGEFCYRASHRYDVPCFEKGEDCPVINSFRTGTRHSGTHVHFDQNGDPIYVELKAFPLRDFHTGQIIAVLETINDISEKINLKERLKTSEIKYRELYNHTPVMLFNINDAGFITECNQLMADKLGMSKERLKGTFFLSLLSSESQAEFEKKRTLCRTDEVCILEVEMLDVKGNIIPVRLTGKKVVERSGAFYSLIGQDITELKKALHEKEILEAQLLQAQKMESIGTLSAGIAHDFNNILTGLMGYTDLLGKIQTSSQGRDYIHRMTELLNIASNLTKQLLIVGRKAETEYQVFELNAFLKEFISTIQRIIGDTITVEARLHNAPIYIKGDTSQIYQMMMNLFVNARDAICEGGSILLRTEVVKPSPQEGQYHHTRVVEYALVSIKDTGTGIPAEIQDRIFDPFFTTKTDRSIKGTGLGLSVVYSIVTAHKGRIEFESEEGKGTEFRIYLPLSPEEASDTEIVNEEREKTVRLESTILVVDDEDIILDVVDTVLTEAGMKVLRAQSGAEAIEVFRNYEGKIDIVILDMSMPGMNGIETFHRLREIDPGLRAILSSGYSQEKKEEFLNMGFVGCLRKPYRINDILDIVLKHLL
ncbi:MAG: PAS domain-containing protein [Nitrospirae bacterium]|nr:PAS domain-containing protein [Nitrospirota bacterium]